MPQRPSLTYRNTPTSYSKSPPPRRCGHSIARGHLACVFVPPRVLCAENPDLVQLKSLLAGLTLPVKSSSAEVPPEERDGESGPIRCYEPEPSIPTCLRPPPPDDLSSGSLPLVNISASVSLSGADMTTYVKKMSRGEAVEGE